MIRLLDLAGVIIFILIVWACSFELDINIKSLVGKNKTNVTRLVVTFIFFVWKATKGFLFKVLITEA